jgi:hypothetical protein
MLKRQSKTAFQLILGGCIMMAVAVGCSDASTTTETKTDSTAADTTDTMKMDTANTKPIVIPDEPAK